MQGTICLLFYFRVDADVFDALYVCNCIVLSYVRSIVRSIIRVILWC